MSDPTPSRRTTGRSFTSRTDTATLGLLLVAAAASWAATSRAGDAGMRVGVLTGQADSSMEMGTVSMALGLFLATWTVMMVAMMFPAAAPVVLTFRRWVHQRGRPSTTVLAFVAGYLAVWSAIGVAAYAVMLGLDEVARLGDTTAVRVGGGLLVLAGLYQFSPLKRACLLHCRSPLTLLVQHSQRLAAGHRGPFRVGVVHGTYCLGCCWALMVVLIALGMMSLAWMASVTALIFAEKVFGGWQAIGRVVGVALGLAGAVLVAAPGLMAPMS